MSREQLDAKQQGRLTIFLGAAPGVGKTFAMLRAARKIQRKGANVIAGAIEAHGRIETEKLLHHFPIIPKKNIVYKGKIFAAFIYGSYFKSKAGYSVN